MPAEQDYTPKPRVKRAMTAAERYAYKSLPEDLRRRKEDIESTTDRIIDFLALLKEFGVEIVAIGSADYAIGSAPAYDPEHVKQREQMLGPEFAGELSALEVFDQIKHQSIRREVGRLGKDFVKKVTQLQQLMESLDARFATTVLPLTRSKAAELPKFEKELRQRVSDISYLTHQHAELVAAAQDARVGDQEEANGEIIEEYQRAVMPYVTEYEELREEYGTLPRLAFRRRRELIDRLDARADAIKALNKKYEQYDFIDFIAFEMPGDEG